MSTKTAGLAVKMGYNNVKVMLQGAPGWQESGGSLLATDKFVQYGNIVLIDLRSPAESAGGHIPRSVNIPIARLSEAEDDFPANKAAPIVFYGNNNTAARAARIVRGWGYKNTATTAGVTAWTAAGHKLSAKPVATTINWQRKLSSGEVSINEFKKVARQGTPDKCILDVRNTDEIANGMFRGAINIPLAQLEARVNELNDGRELLIHCATGARAEMAHAILQKAALRSRFLIASVSCANGNCEVEEE